MKIAPKVHYFVFGPLRPLQALFPLDMREGSGGKIAKIRQNGP